MSYLDIIRDHPDEDDYALARRIIREAPDDVVKIVADHVGTRRRLVTLATETSSFSPRRRSELPADTRDRLAAIMEGVKGETVVYEKGEPPVAWENLTQDQIRRRIAMLTAMRQGIDQTIERLTLLLEFLEKNKLERYSDLDAKPRRRRGRPAA